MRTRRSWRNQERMWRYMGGVRAKQKCKRTRHLIQAEKTALQKLWDRYCTLFDAELWKPAADAYADYLLAKALGD